jgi:hypothetical protein
MLPCKKSFLLIDCRKLAAILSLLQQDGHLCLLQVKDATGNLLHARYFFKIAKSACHKSDQPRKDKDMMKNLLIFCHNNFISYIGFCL